MDKLQPLIKHRYWIIFTFAVIFVIVGWWLASGAIAVATETRRKSVDDSFSKATQGKNEPNAAWVKVAQDRNAVDEKSKMNAAKMLWERQQAARTWPESLAKDFKSVPFQGEVKEVQTRRKWKRVYKDQIESLLKIVQPYDAVKKEGLVVVTINSIDHKPFTKWRYQDPVSAEIWTCQEDIWLLQSLLTSIARVNGEAKRITESNVRKINRLSLRGGDPAATPGAAGGGMGGSMGTMGGMGGMGGDGMGGGLMAGNGMGGSGMMGAGGGGAANYPGKEFEGNSGGDILAEEFGAVAGAGGMGGMDGGAMGGGSSMMNSGMMMSGGGGDSGAAAAPEEEDRYVDEKEGQYKTRAFLLDVVVRDDQLPNLLASLTNSDFPVEIRRVEVHSGVIQTSSGNASTGGMSMNGGSPVMDLGGRGGKGDEGSDSAMGVGSGNSGTLGMDMGMGSGGMGMGMGMGMGGMGGMGLGGGGAASSDPMSVALSDPLLVTVKIGGLMTLYQSLAETAAQEETEKAAVTEQSTATPPDPAEATSAEQGSALEGASTEGTPATTEAPSGENANPTANTNGTGEAPAANTSDSPTDGNMPAENAPPTDGDPAKPSDGPNGESGEPKPDEGLPDAKAGDAASPAEGEKPASEGPAVGEPGGNGEPKSGGETR